MSQPAATAPSPVEQATAAVSETAETPAPLIVEGVSEFSDKVERFIDEPSLSNAVDTFLPVLLDIGRVIFIVVVFLVVVSFISRWASKAASKGLERTRIDTTLSGFLARMAGYLVWVLSIPIALGVLGIEATSLAAIIGAAGIAIGLGLQGALANISAGIVLLVLRPIRIGDYVVIQDETGEVKDIGLFYTVITNFDNELVSIPNQQILSNKVQNLTGNETRVVEIAVGVAYGTDLKLARQTLLDAAASVESRDKSEEPDAWLTGFGASSIDFIVRVDCPSRTFFVVRHEAVQAVNDALNSAGIEIPFPNRTISGRLELARPPTNKD